MTLHVIVEADGGSRGNPGPAGYGAVVRDANSGELLREAAAGIGVASNNVAEYRGLIAGLDAPSSGEVLIDSVDITRLGEDALARLRGEKIGFVFQFFTSSRR